MSLRTIRQTRKPQLALGEARIEDIKLDHVPAVLLGLQHLYSHEETREKLFSLLEEHILPGTNRNVGRPGMELWRILVMGVLKQGLGCDFDRLHELVNQHRTVREFLGHGAFSQDDTYEFQTIIDNVYLLTPELLSKIGQLVVESGHAVARKKPGEPLRGRCDSFVVETDVHYPTDVNLLWDAMRCLLRELGRAARKHHLGGSRQWRHLTQEVKRCFNKVRSTRRAKSRPDRVEAYLERCCHLVGRAEESCKELEHAGVAQSTTMQALIAHARRQMDQVERRLLKGETIAHDEKVFSFSRNTPAGCRRARLAVRWIGVPVCVVEDQFQFILHHKILWEGSDTDIAVSVINETQALHRDLRVCSFDRFHSPGNRAQLDAMLDLNALSGRLSVAEREREGAQAFAEASSRQSTTLNIAVSTGRSHGADGFAHTVALSILAANLHRIGCLCDGACVRPNDVEDAALPERGHLLRTSPPPARHTETGTAFGARKSGIRAGLTPAWCRCGRCRGRNLAESVAVRRRFRAKVGVFWQSADSDFSPPLAPRFVSFARHYHRFALLRSPRGRTIPRGPGPLLPRRPRRLSTVEKTRSYMEHPITH